MKTASIREVRHDFGRILAWVADGEEVAITKRRVTVARLSPVPPRKLSRTKMPDISARLKKVFGGKVISKKKMRVIWQENRGGY